MKAPTYPVINKTIINIDLGIFNPVYIPYYKSQKRFLVLYGGSGSGKSFFAGQKLLFRSLSEVGHRFLLVRKVSRSIRNSSYKLLRDLVRMYNLGQLYDFIDSDLSIRVVNGNEFLSSGVDDPEKLKSIQGITGIWVEEATELTPEDLNQLNLRLRGKTNNYKQIILTFNPVSNNHYMVKRFIQSLPGNADVVKTTYRDNRFIDEEYITELHELVKHDRNMYRIYVLGEPGVLEHSIYQPFRSIPLDQYPTDPEEIIYGLDFGYNNPTALVEVQYYDGEIYLIERLYKRGLSNADLIDRLKSIVPEEYRRSRPIYADSAEPARIEEISNAGFLVYGANKDVRSGIDYCLTRKIYTNPHNENLNHENISYVWKRNKDGEILDIPVKENDHLLDAMRYAIYTHHKNNREVTDAEVW